MRIYPALGVFCILNKVGVVCSFDERLGVWSGGSESAGD